MKPLTISHRDTATGPVLRVTGDAALAGVPGNLLRVLTLVGLDQVFTLRPHSDPAS